MTYYWERFINREQLRTYLKQGCEVFDCSTEGASVEMKQSYPTYEPRDFRVFCNGSCVGYTSREIAQDFLTDVT
jgi:hypothetical protein